MAIDTTHLTWLILGMFAVTYPSRLLPIIFFNKRKPPLWLERWLRYVPLAIFSALLAQIAAAPAPSAAVTTNTLLTIIITFTSTFWTRSFGWGVAIGFAAHVVLHYFLPIFS